MNSHFERSTLSNAPGPPRGASTSSASAQPLRIGSAKRPFARLDLHRGLLMHRRIALGFALFGILLTAVYLLRLWSVETAHSLANMHPTPFGVIRNATVLLLGFTLLGAVAAVVAHKIDPRVYIASDVEHLLGFAPLAQLPDFSEVSDEVAAEHLMLLAARIDSALKNRRVRNCVFTGTGHGAGATTVAGRVKEMIETLERVAVFVDATEMKPVAPGGAAGNGRHAAQQGPCTGAPPHQPAEETEGRSGEMVLIDTAPLAGSAEAERQVQLADCTVVVIASGVTTRAQLLATANTLRRLNAPAVGFVLNRVRLATADHAFRCSQEEMERDLRDQNESVDRQMLRTLRFALESGRASLEPEAAMDAQSAASPLAEITSAAAAAEEPRPAAEMLPEAQASTAAELQRPEPMRNDAAPPPQEIPWQLHKTLARADTALTQPQAPGGGKGQEDSRRSDGSELAQETPKPPPEEDAHLTLPPLSELRGMLFSAGLKELDLARHGVAEGSDAAAGISEVPPLAQPFERIAPEESAAHAQAPQAEAGSAPVVHTFIPIPEPEVKPAAKNKGASQSIGSRRVEAQPEFLSSKPVMPAKFPARHEGKPSEVKHSEDSTQQARGEAPNGVQILPSKRGQYKRKD